MRLDGCGQKATATVQIGKVPLAKIFDMDRWTKLGAGVTFNTKYSKLKQKK